MPLVRRRLSGSSGGLEAGLAGNDSILLNEANGPLPPANILGGPGNDTLSGGSSGDTLFGHQGNDVLLGKGGAISSSEVVATTF